MNRQHLPTWSSSKGYCPTGGDSYLGVVNNELVKTLNAQVILVASAADKTIDQLDDQIEYAANAFGGLEKILGVIINRYPVDKSQICEKSDRSGTIRKQAIQPPAARTHRRRAGQPGT